MRQQDENGVHTFFDGIASICILVHAARTQAHDFGDIEALVIAETGRSGHPRITHVLHTVRVISLPP
jgi:hypothetical protein